MAKSSLDTSLEVQKTIFIQADPATLWHALTDRETISKYFFGTEAISDWKVGSTLIFRGEWEGKRYEDKGHILASEKPNLLQYDYWSGFSGLEDIRENYSTVTYRIREVEGGSEVSLTQKGFAGKEAMTHAEGGWTMVLDNLKKLLEQG
jgi:uncharacterized protein YndB with AHSA1/START domain